MTRQREIGRLLAVASAILTILLAFACGATTSADGGGRPSGTPSGPPTSTGPAPTSSSVPATSAPPSTETTETVQPPEVRECVAADLALAVDSRQGGGAAGTVYRSLVFTNSGDQPCVMVGFPGVSYVTGDSGEQVGPAAGRVGQKGAPVTVPVGGTAEAEVGFTQVGNFDQAACEPTPVRGLRVYPPHDTASMFVPQPGHGCAGQDIPSPQLTVRTVR